MSEETVGYSWEDIVRSFGESNSFSLISQHVLGVKFAVTFKLLKAKEMRDAIAEITKHVSTPHTTKRKFANRAGTLLKNLDSAIARLDKFNNQITELAESMVFDMVNMVKFYKRFTKLTAKVLKVIDRLNVYLEAAEALKSLYDSVFSEENKEDAEE